MNDFMKTILSAVKTWTKGEIKDSVADWDQNDPTKSNYVENRTHYDSREEREVRITFDGNLDGMEYVSIPGMSGFYYVKVSELAPTAEELVGGKVVLRNGDEISHDEIREVVTVEPGVRVYGEMVGAMFLDAPLTQMGITMTAGTWFPLVDQNGTLAYIAELSYTVTSGELKKLDAKYLPMESIDRYDLAFKVVGQEIIGGSVDRVWEKLNSGHPPIIILYVGFGTGDGIKHVMHIPTAIYEWSDDNNIYFGVDFDAKTFGFTNHEGSLRAVFNSHEFEYITEL